MLNLDKGCIHYRNSFCLLRFITELFVAVCLFFWGVCAGSVKKQLNFLSNTNKVNENVFLKNYQKLQVK